MKIFLFIFIISLVILPLGNLGAVEYNLIPDTLIKGGESTVYYYALDGNRYVFPNYKTFESWFKDFREIIIISNEKLTNIPLKGNVVYRPGVKMVKIKTSPKVYAVDKGGVLRWIKTETLAEQLYGKDWKQKIDDIPEEFIINYTEGNPIESKEDYSPEMKIREIETINKNKDIIESSFAVKSNTDVGGVMMPVSINDIVEKTVATSTSPDIHDTVINESIDKQNSTSTASDNDSTSTNVSQNSANGNIIIDQLGPTITALSITPTSIVPEGFVSFSVTAEDPSNVNNVTYYIYYPNNDYVLKLICDFTSITGNTCTLMNSIDRGVNPNLLGEYSIMVTATDGYGNISKYYSDGSVVGGNLSTHNLTIPSITISEESRDLATISSSLSCNQNFTGYDEDYSTKDQFNILDYGAACDGVTDDSSAIQAANDAASLVNGAVIYPSNSTCLVQGVNIKADQIATSTTLKMPDNADNWMFNISTKKLRISGFIFDGNKANQPTPTYTENYDGFEKNSLIQAFTLFTDIVIENNTFKDTQYGAISFRDQTSLYGGTADLISTVKITDNTFQDIGADAVTVLNPYDQKQIQGNDVIYNGSIIFTNNIGLNLGTITEVIPATGQTNQGDVVIIGGFKCAYIIDNTMENAVRVEYKLGTNNLAVIDGNTSTDVYWSMVQMRTFYVDDVANNVLGGIYITNNTFSTQNVTGLFVQLTGSTDATANHSIYPYTLIDSNTATHYGNDYTLTDAVQLTSLGKFDVVRVINNVFTNIRRAAVSISLPIKDNFVPSELLIQNNTMSGSNATSANGIFFAQGAGSPIEFLKIIGNSTTNTQVGIWAANTDFATQFLVRDNSFDSLGSAWAIWASGSTEVDQAIIKDNTLDGRVNNLSTGQEVWSGNSCGTHNECS